MSSDHINARRKLQAIPLISDFNGLLDLLTISEEDKELMRLHYIERKDFRFIGDALGYCETTVKERHKAVLRKLSSII